jgi:hypothetical protein
MTSPYSLLDATSKAWVSGRLPAAGQDFSTVDNAVASQLIVALKAAQELHARLERGDIHTKSARQRARVETYRIRRYHELLIEAARPIVKNLINERIGEFQKIGVSFAELETDALAYAATSLIELFDASKGEWSALVRSKVAWWLGDCYRDLRYGDQLSDRQYGFLVKVKRQLQKAGVETLSPTDPQLRAAVRAALDDHRAERCSKGHDEETVDAWLTKQGYKSVVADIAGLWEIFATPLPASLDAPRSRGGSGSSGAERSAYEALADPRDEDGIYRQAQSSRFQERLEQLLADGADADHHAVMFGEVDRNEWGAQFPINQRSAASRRLNVQRRAAQSRVSAPHGQWAWLTDISRQLTGTWPAA